MRKAIIIMVVLVLLSCKRDEPGPRLDIRSINTGNSELLSDAVSSQLYEANVRSWYGTDMGLSKLQDSGWAEYSMGTFMLNNDKVSSLGLYSNQILIGTRGGGVNRLVVEGLDAVSGASPYDSVWTGLPSGHINCILVDAGDGKWFGTPLGLSLHEGDGTKEGWTSYTTDNGLVSNNITAISEGQSGDVWIGTDKGLSIINDGEINNYSTGTPLEGRQIHTICITCYGNAWLGCEGGLVWMNISGEEATWEEIAVYSGSNITALLMDSDFDLWVGTEDGLSVYRDGNLLYRNEVEVFIGLRITDIFQVLDSGGISITTDEGIFIATKS